MMTSSLPFPVLRNPLLSSNCFLGFSRQLNFRRTPLRRAKNQVSFPSRARRFNGNWSSSSRRVVSVCGLLPVDPWAPNIDSQSIASQLFAVSLFPYLGFLYFITKSQSTPKLTLFGFYFLLAFVGATKFDDSYCGKFIFGNMKYPKPVYFSTLLMCFVFSCLNALEFGTVPAGIYAKVHYGTSLSNVDWLHGCAESLLTLTNVFIVLGLREALRKGTNPSDGITEAVQKTKEDQSPVEVER